MHRDDASTGGQMDTWLQIAETRINERVRALEMKGATALDETDGHLAPATYCRMTSWRFYGLVVDGRYMHRGLVSYGSLLS